MPTFNKYIIQMRFIFCLTNNNIICCKLNKWRNVIHSSVCPTVQAQPVQARKNGQNNDVHDYVYVGVKCATVLSPVFDPCLNLVQCERRLAASPQASSDVCRCLLGFTNRACKQTLKDCLPGVFENTACDK